MNQSCLQRYVSELPKHWNRKEYQLKENFLSYRLFVIEDSIHRKYPENMYFTLKMKSVQGACHGREEVQKAMSNRQRGMSLKSNLHHIFNADVLLILHRCGLLEVTLHVTHTRLVKTSDFAFKMK